MSDPDADRPRGQLFEEAAAWFARMRGPDAEASRDDFEAWLARGALHRSAYNRAAEIFAMGKLLQDPDAQDARPAERAQRRLMPAAAALAAVSLAAGAGWIGLRQAAEPHRGIAVVAGQSPTATRPLELASQTREGGMYRLNDGSLVTLGASTRLRVDMTPQARRLVLEAGESRFEVAHEARPFIVYAGGGSVTARGTVFDVALSSDRRVRVRLIEGVIDVAVPSPAPTPRRQRLVAGQSTSFAVQRRPESAQQRLFSSGGNESAEGPREYDGVRLSDLIEAANRSSQKPIRMSGAIGEHRVSGRFRIDDTDLLADRIAALFDLLVDRSNPSAIVLKPR